MAYGLGFGTITSYVPITPGAYTIAANSTGTAEVLSAANGTFLPATQYTVLISDTAAGPQQLTLKDQNQPAPSGQIALRFIGQSTRIGPVDIYLVRRGQTLADARPVATNITLGVNTGYLNIPTGTYTIVTCLLEPSLPARLSLFTPGPRLPTAMVLPAPSSSSTNSLPAAITCRSSPPLTTSHPAQCNYP